MFSGATFRHTARLSRNHSEESMSNAKTRAVKKKHRKHRERMKAKRREQMTHQKSKPAAAAQPEQG